MEMSAHSNMDMAIIGDLSTGHAHMHTAAAAETFAPKMGKYNGKRKNTVHWLK